VAFVGALWIALGSAGPALGQSNYTYLTAIGTPGVRGTDNAHFSQPSRVAVDTAHGHVFVADPNNKRVQVFDSATFAYVATITAAAPPPPQTPGSVTTSNAEYLIYPVGVTIDTTNDHILIADDGNDLIQVFDAANLAYVATIGNGGLPPTGIAVRPAIGASKAKIFVVSFGSTGIEVFDATTFAPIFPNVSAGASINPNTGLSINYDSGSDQLLVTNSSEQVEIFDPETLLQVGTLGKAVSAFSLVYDPVTGQILAPSGSGSLIFDGLTGLQVGSLSTQAGMPTMVYIDSAAVDTVHNHLFVEDDENAAVYVFTIAPPALQAAILPGGRSVQVGSAATIFATIINSGTTSLTNCRIALPSSAPAGVAMTYQTTSAATNAPTGTPNAPVTIAAGAAQSFVLSFTSSGAAASSAMPLDFACSNTAAATVVAGVNAVDLLFSATPIADVIALSLTPSGDGIARLPIGGTGFFASASINIGAATQLTATVDTGAADLPLSAVICQTDPVSGACLSPPAASVTYSAPTNGTATFTAFLTPSAAIPFSPAVNRAFVRFKDSAGVSHGSTGVAIATE